MSTPIACKILADFQAAWFGETPQSHGAPEEPEAQNVQRAISGSRAEADSFPSVTCARPVMALLRASGALGGLL